MSSAFCYWRRETERGPVLAKGGLHILLSALMKKNNNERVGKGGFCWVMATLESFIKVTNPQISNFISFFFLSQSNSKLAETSDQLCLSCICSWNTCEMTFGKNRNDFLILYKSSFQNLPNFKLLFWHLWLFSICCAVVENDGTQSGDRISTRA